MIFLVVRYVKVCECMFVLCVVSVHGNMYYVLFGNWRSICWGKTLCETLQAFVVTLHTV